MPIGRPIWNTQIYILDKYGEPVPVGVTGELYIGGAGVARGYLNRAELTAERFLPNPFSTDSSARLYRSGDLGRYLANANIEFLGRNDFQVKIRGFRIELGEIEARLAEHPGVRDAVVIAREDTPGDKRLVAYFTAAGQDISVNAEVLRNHLSAKLAEYMVPAAYVSLESLPLTANGKLDRKALPAPESDAYVSRGYEAPQGETETILAAIWAKVLKISKIGRHDNFFELGGHSLLAVRVIHLLEPRGLRIAAPDFFRYPTLAYQAANIHNGISGSGTHKAICVREGSDNRPLFLTDAANDELFYVNRLTPYIDSSIPIYAVPYGDTPFQTVEKLASLLVSMIRNVQPVGPYRIAGWSLGGVFAYEIAAQLIGDNQTVEFLGLLDAPYLKSSSYLSGLHPEDESQSTIFLALAEKTVGTDDKARTEFETVRSEAPKLTFAALVETCQRMGFAPERFAGFAPAQIESRICIWRQRTLIAARYSAPHIPITAYLFTAQNQPEVAGPYLGWDAIVSKNHIRVIPVPGTHISMMEPPNVESVGESLSCAIRDAENEMNAETLALH